MKEELGTVLFVDMTMTYLFLTFQSALKLQLDTPKIMEQLVNLFLSHKLVTPN